MQVLTTAPISPPQVWARPLPRVRAALPLRVRCVGQGVHLPALPGSCPPGWAARL